MCGSAAERGLDSEGVSLAVDVSGSESLYRCRGASTSALGGARLRMATIDASSSLDEELAMELDRRLARSRCGFMVGVQHWQMYWCTGRGAVRI